MRNRKGIRAISACDFRDGSDKGCSSLPCGAGPGKMLLLAMAFAMTLTVLTGSSAKAGSGQLLTLPRPNVTPKSGIRLTLDWRWVEGRGYRPVRVTATASKPAKYDQTLTVRIRVAGLYYSDGDPTTTVVEDLELPAGSITVAQTIAVPQFQEWGRMTLDTFLDGNYIEELSNETIISGNRYRIWDDGYPRVLVVGDEQQAGPLLISVQLDFREIEIRSGMMRGASEQQLTSLGPLSRWETAAHRLPAELPTRWIDYSCLDIVYLTVNQLRTLPLEHPEAWHAIRRWIATGGNLWVQDVGDDWRGLAAIEDAFDLPNTPADDPLKRGWQQEPGSSVIEILEDATTPSEETLSPQPEPTPSVQPVVHRWRNFRMGRIVALPRLALQGSPDLSKVPAAPAGELSGAIDHTRESWSHRHGLMPDGESLEFWNLLIPGVGLAPVTEFRVLITVFVLVIGPLNYYLLRRWRRRNLLLLTVPTCAALITVSLFVYALVSDGLGTRVRVRSYTDLDQQRGEAVCWSRQSYYAGLAPSEGMQMPGDSVVLPFLPGTNQNVGYEVSNDRYSRHVEWAGDQHLTEGWLAARTPTQYVVLRAHNSAKKVSVISSDIGLRIENQLGTGIRQILLCDPSGNFHWGQNILEGAKESLQPVTRTDGTGRLRATLADHEPRFPLAMQAGNSGQVFGIRRRGYRSWSSSGYNNTYGAPTQRDSRLEQSIAALLSNETPLGPQTYVAIVDRSPAVALGVDSASEEESLHVVFGRW